MSWLSSIIGDIPGVGPLINDVGGALINGAKGAVSSGHAGSDVLTLLGVLNAAGLQNKANSYAQNALSTAQDTYSQKAPLRVGGIAGMQYSASHGNPFAEGYTAPTGPSALPIAGGRPRPVAAGSPASALATVPPSPTAASTPAALRIATTPGGGTAPPGLASSNALELAKLYP